MKRLLAVYRDQSLAARGVRALERHGFAPDSISMLAADSASGQAFMATKRTSSAEAAMAGAALGSGGGLVAASVAGIGAIFTGPIGITLAGAVAGGLLGGLVGLGIPENEAVLRMRDLQDGAILVAVDLDAEDREREAAALHALGRTDYQRMLSVDDPEIVNDHKS